MEKAVAFLRESQPDVVMLDNQLPDGYGVELLAYIKKQYPQIRVVMMTGYGAAVKDQHWKVGLMILWKNHLPVNNYCIHWRGLPANRQCSFLLILKNHMQRMRILSSLPV